MEESRRHCCSMRRLAISAIACCWATHAIADETLGPVKPNLSGTLAEIFREKPTLIVATEIPASLQSLETAPIVKRLDAKQLRQGTLPSEWELPEPTSAALDLPPSRAEASRLLMPTAISANSATKTTNLADASTQEGTAPVELPMSAFTAATSPTPKTETVTEQAELDAAFALKHFEAFAKPTASSAMNREPDAVIENRLAIDQLAPATIPLIGPPDAIALPDPVLPAPMSMNPISAESMSQVHRLRELSHQSLQNAKQSLRRGATHSARKYATESLRLTVDMQDARDGGNRHARQLEAALDAIRESEDFCGRFGAVDTRSMERMVAVHETTVLKKNDLSQMSAMQATETYLQVAKDGLVAATGDGTDACDALVMLGIIEQKLAGESGTHAPAVAITMQRAAIEISPNNANAYRELGNTLINQGLVRQAAWALDQSIHLNPSRSAYEGRLQASRRMGDVESAQRCLTALNDPNLSSGIAIQTLSPEAFAASFHPGPANFQTASSPTTASAKASTTPSSDEANTSSDATATRMSIRSLWPFGRR